MDQGVFSLAANFKTQGSEVREPFTILANLRALRPANYSQCAVKLGPIVHRQTTQSFRNNSRLLEDKARDTYGRILPIPIGGNTFENYLEVAHLSRSDRLSARWN